MPAGLYQSVLILLQCRHDACGRLNFDEYHAAIWQQDHPVWHACSAWACELVGNAATQLGVFAYLALNLCFGHYTQKASPHDRGLAGVVKVITDRMCL